jgi:hypothetical protein
VSKNNVAKTAKATVAEQEAAQSDAVEEAIEVLEHMTAEELAEAFVGALDKLEIELAEFVFQKVGAKIDAKRNGAI